MSANFEIYPGGDIVEKGLADLKNGARSEEALVVLAAAPRLRRLGFSVPILTALNDLPEHALYDLLAEKDAASAHTRYNALIQRVFSFVQSYRP